MTLACKFMTGIMTLASVLLSGHVRAENPKVTITITGQVTIKTCTFDQTTQNVTLPTLTTRNFAENNNDILGETTFDVDINCNNVVTAVSIVPSGEADEADPTAFKNTGGSGNVALRLLDAEGGVLTPDESSKVNLALVDGTGRYTFKVGYTATGTVSGGDFLSMATLKFDYN